MQKFQGGIVMGINAINENQSKQYSSAQGINNNQFPTPDNVKVSSNNELKELARRLDSIDSKPKYVPSQVFPNRNYVSQTRSELAKKALVYALRNSSFHSLNSIGSLIDKRNGAINTYGFYKRIKPALTYDIQYGDLAFPQSVKVVREELSKHLVNKVISNTFEWLLSRSTPASALAYAIGPELIYAVMHEMPRQIEDIGNGDFFSKPEYGDWTWVAWQKKAAKHFSEGIAAIGQIFRR
jgi:hypothetical protein